MKQLGAIAVAVVSTLIYVSPAVAEDKPAQAPRHVRSMSQTVTAQATVEAIDQQTRHVTLKTEDGKSMPAALLVSAFHAALQLLFDEGRELGDVATELNRHLHNWSAENKFVTSCMDCHK